MATTVPSLVVSGFTHHTWYMPGDVVRVQLYLDCTRMPNPDRANTYQPMPTPSNHNYFNVDTPTETAAKDAEVFVTSLKAAVSGYVDADRSLIDFEFPSESRRGSQCGVSSSLSLIDVVADPGGRAGQARVADKGRLFGSRWWDVAAGTHLRSPQCVAFCFTFRLPESLPPTFASGVASAWTEVGAVATWRRVNTRSPEAEGQTRSWVRIPIHVYNPFTVISHFSFAASFPLDAADPLLKRDYDFMVAVLPAVPAASISGPLSDSLFPSQTQIRPLSSVFHERLAATMGTTSNLDHPELLLVPVGADPQALEVSLQSSAVPLGGSVRGALRDHTPSATSRGVAGDPPVLVRATATLELLECCPEEAAIQRDGVGQVPGVAGVAMLASRVKATQELVLLDSPVTPFSFALAAPADPPTLLTDIGILLWQLRIQVHWTTQAELSKSTEKGAREMKIESSENVLVIPITVTPPPVPSRPRCGRVYTSFHTS